MAHVCDLSPSMIKTQAEKSRGTTARVAIELKWYAKVRSLITGKDQSHTRVALCDLWARKQFFPPYLTPCTNKRQCSNHAREVAWVGMNDMDCFVVGGGEAHGSDRFALSVATLASVTLGYGFAFLLGV